MNLSIDRKFNFKQISRALGGLALLESIFLLVSFAVAIYFSESEKWHFLLSFAIAFAVGLSGLLYGRNASSQTGKREGTVIVTCTWIVFSLLGMLPYWTSGNIPSFTNAFFETISGFTATGSSTIADVEIMPKSILFWRSMTHWIGGLGIIVISLAVLPIFGFSSSQLFSAEVTGVQKEKISPKIRETAKRLLAIYLGLTIAQTLLMWCFGMSFFDAVCNSFSTVSTGGFSTKNASISYWNSSAIEWTVIGFMIASGINFSLLYYLFKGRIKKFLKDEEMRTYIFIMAIAAILVSVSILNINDLSWQNIGNTFRDSVFTVSSLMTTTGFYTVDYSHWTTVAFILLLLTIIGGSASSTTGGLKVVRILLVFKYCYYEFKRMLHPRAVFPVRYNGKVVKEQIITRTLAYVLLFAIFALVGSAILCLNGLDFDKSIGVMISSLSNVGPCGWMGTFDGYSSISTFSKWFLSFVMLVGRLEIFTVLLIFTPDFWKK